MAATLFAFFVLSRGVRVSPLLFKRHQPFPLLQTIFAHGLAHTPEEKRTAASAADPTTPVAPD